MGNFQRGNRSGFSGRGSDRDRQSGDRSFQRPGLDRPQMFRATCANCGIQCEVPFRPTGSKPVLCNNCFGNNSGRNSSASRRSFSDRDARVRTSFNDRPMHDAICTNCGSACRIPFEPKEGREILCSDCFEVRNGVAPRQSSRMGGDRGPRRENTNSQMEMLNAKLDKIIALLEGKEKKADKKKPAKTEVLSLENESEEVVSSIPEDVLVVDVTDQDASVESEEAPKSPKKKSTKKKK